MDEAVAVLGYVATLSTAVIKRALVDYGIGADLLRARDLEHLINAQVALLKEVDQMDDLDLNVSLPEFVVKGDSSTLNFFKLILTEGWVPLC